CVLVQALGIRGSAPKVMARAMKQVRDSRRGRTKWRTTTIPILEIVEARSGRREYAFLFANGVISRVISRYTEGNPSPARAARVFSEAVGGFMMQTPAARELTRRHHALVTVDGKPLQEDRVLGILAGTIQPYVLGFHPFVTRKRLLHSFKYAAGMVDAAQVIGMLPALLRGRLWKTHPGLLNATAREMRIVTDEGYILDGEVHPSGVPRELVIRVGPRLRFLRP
ncbi:MAG TPA: hypothetical protein VMV18_15920, partial [bacterium]|nr:hypothetical protein [bacterium]